MNWRPGESARAVCCQQHVLRRDPHHATVAPAGAAGDLRGDVGEEAGMVQGHAQVSLHQWGTGMRSETRKVSTDDGDGLAQVGVRDQKVVAAGMSV